MPHDQKIGLALGILLVGVVGAFFFRHEPPVPERLPSLKTAAELDAQIATGDRTPYLKGVDPAPPPIVQTVPVEPLGPVDPLAGLVPEPIAGPEPILERRTDSGLADRGQRTTSDGGHGETRLHQVQRGETLSSLAGKYLGSQTRFEEIFAANTDQLRNPNDVRPGMTLKIPPKDRDVATRSPVRSAERVARQEAELFKPEAIGATGRNTAPVDRLPDGAVDGGDRSSTSGAGSTNGAPTGTGPDSGAPKRLFEPYRRSPLLPANGQPASDPKSAAGRRLSQSPPVDAPVLR